MADNTQTSTTLKLVPSPVSHMLAHIPDDVMIREHHCYVYRGSQILFGGPRWQCEQFIAKAERAA